MMRTAVCLVRKHYGNYIPKPYFRQPGDTVENRTARVPLDLAKTYTSAIESTEDFQFVARLLPRDTVPPIPQHSLDNYPTPSLWVPPAKETPDLPYFVRRTCNHMLPVYQDLFFGTKTLTRVRHIEGDIWALEKDLRSLVENQPGLDGLSATQVNEVTRSIRVKGNFVELIKKFLLERGF